MAAVGPGTGNPYKTAGPGVWGLKRCVLRTAQIFSPLATPRPKQQQFLGFRGATQREAKRKKNQGPCLHPSPCGTTRGRQELGHVSPLRPRDALEVAGARREASKVVAGGWKKQS